jgi:hypothetical protein
MPEQSSPIEAKTVKSGLRTMRIDSPPSYVYSNVAGVSLTPWDVRINFADVNPTDPAAMDQPEDTILRIAANTGIVMPPEHAAGLAILLVQQLQVYEQQFGPIRHPKWKTLNKEMLGDSEPSAE